MKPFASSYDNLKFANDKDVKKVVNNEEIYFSHEVIKINRKNDNQVRNLVITNKALYNLKKKSLKRRIDLSIVQGITLSSISHEFVIHGSDEYDYHYDCVNGRIIAEIIGVALYQLTKKKLKCVILPESNLNIYVTQKSDKKLDPNCSKMKKDQQIDIDKYLYGNFTKEKFNYFSMGTVMTREKAEVIFAYNLENGGIFDSNLLESFKVCYHLSNSIYGKVFVAEFIPTQTFYLIRSFDNPKDPNQKILIDTEKLHSLLEDKFPFFSEIKFAFKTKTKTFIASNYEQFLGGYLFYNLNKPVIFNEDITKIYLVQIALIIDFLHKKGYLNINFSPENFLLDEKGYIKYINYEIEHQIQEENQIALFNKPKEYIAPEFIGAEINYKNADWYCLGVMAYELLYGIPPSYDKTTGKIIFPRILESSIEARDLIEKLLTKDVYKRLGGKKGIEEIKSHAFFKGVDFEKIKNKEVKIDILFIQQKEQEAQSAVVDDNKEEVTLESKDSNVVKEHLPDVSNYEVIEVEEEEEWTC